MLIKKYPDYATNLNIYNESFLNYLDINDKIIDLIKKNKNINWIKLLNNQVEIDEFQLLILIEFFSWFIQINKIYC